MITNKPEWEKKLRSLAGTIDTHSTDGELWEFEEHDLKEWVASQIEKAEKREYERFKEENPKLFCSHEVVSGYQCQDCYAIKSVDGWN